MWFALYIASVMLSWWIMAKGWLCRFDTVTLENGVFFMCFAWMPFINLIFAGVIYLVEWSSNRSRNSTRGPTILMRRKK